MLLGRSFVVLAGLAACGLTEASVSCFNDGKFKQADWHCQQVDPEVLVYYKVNGDFLMLGMHAANHVGWSALAFAGNGGMKGARQIVVRKVDGAFVAEDRYSTAYSQPVLDEKQDVELAFAVEESGSTSWGVILPMDACKVPVDGMMRNYPIEDTNRWMHWAKGSSHSFQYHGTSRAQFHVNLVSGPISPPNLDGLREVDLRMPNASVVLGEGGTDATNPYICGIFDLEKLLPEGVNIADKIHVAKFSPFLDVASEKYVHHMILFGCDEQMMEGLSTDYTHGQIIGECESMPAGCYEMKWPWAMGSTDVVFPDNVGMPFGEGKKWLALQMHYYNPALDSGVRDSSGVRLTFANAPRAQDAAVLALNGGTSPRSRADLPAGQSEVKIDFTVPPQCTNMWNRDINVLGVVHHAHLLGKYLNIEVLRGDSYAGVLRVENQYDFNHQSLEESALKTIKKGDELRMTCAYDTSSKTEAVSFGDLTQQEMCWSAVMYYPAQAMSNPSRGKPDDYVGLCQSPGLGTYSDVSFCEMLYMADARLLLGDYETKTAYSMLEACHYYGAGHATVMPGICPSCADTSSCTTADMAPAGKAFCASEAVCGKMGLSVYPDLNNSVPAELTYCGQSEFAFRKSNITAPACAAKGNLSEAASLKETIESFATPPQPTSSSQLSGVRCISLIPVLVVALFAA